VVFGTFDTQAAEFDDGKGLVEIVLNLGLEAGFEGLAEDEGDAAQQQGEDDGVAGGEPEPKSARDVLAFRQKGLSLLL